MGPMPLKKLQGPKLIIWTKEFQKDQNQPTPTDSDQSSSFVHCVDYLYSLVKVNDDLGGMATQENHHYCHQQASHRPVPVDIYKMYKSLILQNVFLFDMFKS